MGATLNIANVPLAAIDREYVRLGGLKAFVEVAWSRIDPAPFVNSKHIDLICDHLTALADGTIRNLLILVPPGTSKSSLACVLFPAWVWTVDPSRKWIFTANDPSLAMRDARRTRTMIESPWWKERWPHCTIADDGSNAVGEYETTAMGFRLSLGIGQRVIGRHADFKAFDDPNKPLDAEGMMDSRVQLQRVIDAWDGTFASRNTNVKTTRTFGVMQRIADMDLAGHIIEKMRSGGEQFEVLRLPMEFEASNKCVTSVGQDWRTDEGELLCPERIDAEAVGMLKMKLGSSRRVAAQLQQRPAPRGGNIIKAEWIRHFGPCSQACRERQCPGPVFDELPPLQDMRLESSWDLTFKGKATSDFVVGQVWGFWKHYAFLLDQARGQWSFTETIREFKKLAEKWPRAFVKRVEDKANAPALVSVLKGEVPGIKLVNPEGGKEDRLRACEGLHEAGVVIYPSPKDYLWVETVNIHEILNFPAAANDDSVDCETQVLLPMAKGSMVEVLKAANKNSVEMIMNARKAVA